MPARQQLQPTPLIAERLHACRATIPQKQVDGYLVTSPIDQYYLTGFDGEDGAVLILPRQVYLLTDGRFAEEAERAAPWARAIIRREALPAVVGKLARRHRIRRLGFQPEAISVLLHDAVRKAVRPTRMVAMPQAVEPLRLCKDPVEIETMKRALRVAEGAFRAVTKRIRVGLTEQQLAADLHHEMLRRGASGAAFPLIVAEGANASRPHARPGTRKIRTGSAVLIDWGATVDHYHSDLTRVIFIRRIPPRYKRMYHNVLAAQRAAIEAIRPGVRLCDVDAVARDVLREAGLEKQFTHGLGHGLGLQVHEPPSLGPRSRDLLKPGMVVTVEPGVYFPGVGGVRIEDDVLVTERGASVLSRLDKDLDAAVV